MYRAFAELAAKQNREESAAAPGEVPVLAPATAQPKGAGGTKQQHQRNLQPSSAYSSRDRLGTIDEEGISEDGTPTSATTAPNSAAIASVDTDGSIWEGEIDASSGDEGLERHDDDGVEGEVCGDTGGPTEAAELSPGTRDDGGGNDDGAQEKYHDVSCSGGDADEAPVSYVPAPRVPVGVVPVGFTTRLFPTPLRESKVADESAWIMKNRRHLHKNKSLVGRLPEAENDAPPADISESDPVWLKGRGDDLYRGGDFLGAVNAYTAALDADPGAAACLSNRAACYLRLSGGSGGSGGSGSNDTLGNLGNNGQSYASACVADCGAALEILRRLPETGPSQARALARRSLAYRGLGHYRSSLEDCRAALAFSPGDASLLEEITRGEPLAKAETCKKEAAKRFASGDVRGACEMYTAALEAVPGFPAALSNRAACYLALGKPRECVRDCTAVLEMLSSPEDGNLSAAGRLSASCGGGDGGDGSLDNLAPAGPTRGQGNDAPPPPAAAGPGVRHATGGKPAIAPSSCPPPLPPPVGMMPAPGSEKRTKWVLTTLLRRARAKVQLEDFEGALRDYRTASAMSPGDKEVEHDLRELERQVSETERPLMH